MAGGYSDAWVDLCEATMKDRTNTVLPPQVFKLGDTKIIDEEANGAEKAKEFIPAKYRVEVLEKAATPDGKMAVLRYRYAGGSLAPDRVRPLLRHVSKEVDASRLSVAVSDVFLKGMDNSYKNRQPRHSSLQELLEEFTSLRGVPFLDQVNEGLNFLESEGAAVVHPNRRDRVGLTFPLEYVDNPLCDTDRTRRIWEVPFPHPTVPVAHRDLNPRNLLMVRDEEGPQFHSVLIDFHRFGGQASLAVDFARLEVGLQIKALEREIREAAQDPEKERELVVYEEAINSGTELVLTECLTPDRFPDVRSELTKIGHVVAAIRSAFVSYMPDGKTDPRAYNATIALSYLSYLRDAYRNRLTVHQRSYAFYCASRILTRTFWKGV
jgi:hypothetical protein